MKTIVEYLQSGHIAKNLDYVDLDLPSGTLWAKMNIGATEGKNPEDWYGLYFAWGETKGYKASDKHVFNWDTYKFSKDNEMIKYNKQDKLIQLENKDDAAYQNTNGKFRMPTIKELEELYKYTDHKYVKNYNNINDLNGIVFTSKTDNITLFIPMSGDYVNNYCDDGYYFYLWSSTINERDPKYVNYLSVTAEDIMINDNIRCNGCTVRGVLNK